MDHYSVWLFQGSSMSILNLHGLPPWFLFKPAWLFQAELFFRSDFLVLDLQLFP